MKMERMNGNDWGQNSGLLSGAKDADCFGGESAEIVTQLLKKGKRKRKRSLERKKRKGKKRRTGTRASNNTPEVYGGYMLKAFRKGIVSFPIRERCTKHAFIPGSLCLGFTMRGFRQLAHWYLHQRGAQWQYYR